MALYKIEWKQSAKKELKKLDKSIIPKIINIVEKLSENPYPSGSRKILGAKNTFRIRTGDYRIIYSVFHDILLIQIVRLGHRQRIYKVLRHDKLP